MPLLALAALLVAAGAWAFTTSLGGVFVLDDVRAIVRNPTIRTLWPVSIPLSPPSKSTVSGRPVANLSFAISYAFGSEAGPGPAGSSERPGAEAALDATAFHAGNLLIHLASALVLFGVVRRTLLSRRLGPVFGTSAPWLALAVALVWVVHPLQTAAVTYVVQRVESLMGLFYLLTLYCAIRAHGDAHARAWGVAACLCCAAGMATKEVMVTAPVVVALWSHLFGVPNSGGTSRVRPILTGSLAATWLILGILVWHEHRGPSISLAPEAVWAYLATQAGVVGHYLRLVFVPAPLAFLYDWPLVSSLSLVAWQAAMLGALILLTVVAVARRHPAAFLGAWFFLVLAPSSSVLPIVTEVAAEHRMYLPLAAVVTAVITGLFVAGRTLRLAPKPAAVASALALVLVVGSLGMATRERNRVYWSAEGLWQDAVNARPSDSRPRVAHGEALAAAGRLAEAETELLVAVALAPEDPAARVRLGAVLARQRKFDAAVPHLERALARRPDDVDAHRWLAEVYAVQRRDQLAVGHYERALAVLPDDGPLLAGLAAILADSRDTLVRNPPRAKELAGRAVRLSGGRDPRVLEILAAAQAACGQFAEAAATVRTAAGIARAAGDRALVSALEHRASAYESASRQLPAAGR